MKRLLQILLLMTLCLKASAQSDPVLSGMILLYDLNMTKTLKNQEAVMLLESTGHIWTREEIEDTKDLQQEFNNYLNSFSTVIAYAAQIYGFYYETDRLLDNLKELTKQLKDHPSGALAVALSSRRNTIYRDVITNSAGIVNDVRLVCMEGSKMTEEERIKVVFGIRPKFKKMNADLKRLSRAVRYTSLNDVWAEVNGMYSYDKANVANISQACMQRWKANGKRFNIN